MVTLHGAGLLVRFSLAAAAAPVQLSTARAASQDRSRQPVSAPDGRYIRGREVLVTGSAAAAACTCTDVSPNADVSCAQLVRLADAKYHSIRKRNVDND